MCESEACLLEWIVAHGEAGNLLHSTSASPVIGSEHLRLLIARSGMLSRQHDRRRLSMAAKQRRGTIITRMGRVRQWILVIAVLVFIASSLAYIERRDLK